MWPDRLGPSPRRAMRIFVVFCTGAGFSNRMSSLRRAVSARTYKERHQPRDRQRFGLLEKHKDYVLRARNFHEKENALLKLREKAALRNPDEFYYRMLNSRLEVTYCFHTVL